MATVNSRWLIGMVLATVVPSVHADGPRDNQPEKVRPIPPPGIAVPAADQAELKAGVEALAKEIEGLRNHVKSKPALLDLLPDIQVYHNAVRYALTYHEFFQAKEIAVAKALLKQGMDRAKALREGRAPWTTATGLVVRAGVRRRRETLRWIASDAISS